MAPKIIITLAPDPGRRKSLEHVCGVCGQRLSVKFNFEGLDDANADHWLELDCIR
jgi:hypothetical protein